MHVLRTFSKIAGDFNDLMKDCHAITACLPQLHVNDVFPFICTHASEQRHQRIRLTLQDIFKEQDSQDNPVARREDLTLIRNLLPDIDESRILSLMPYFGNEKNRKALLLRLLIQDCVIDAKTSKHKLPEDASTLDSAEGLSPKRCKVTVDDASKSLALLENGEVEGGDKEFERLPLLEDVGKFNAPALDLRKVTDGADTSNKNNNFSIDENILKPSTSKAVFNPYSGNYEVGLLALSLKRKTTATTDDLPKPESENAVDIIDLDSYKVPPKSTRKEVSKPLVVLGPPISVDDVDVDVIEVKEVEGAKQNEQIQSGGGEDNKNVEEEISKDSFSDTGTNECSADISESIFSLEDIDFESVLEEAIPNVDIKLVNKLTEMFPQVCPDYLRRMCANVEFSSDTLNELSTQILALDEHPKRKMPVEPEEKLDPEKQCEILREMFPNADPGHLRYKCDQFADNPDALKEFIAEALENHNYPTLADYNRKLQLSAQQKQYLNEFSVSNFLKVIPDPVAYFEDPKRKMELSKTDVHFAATFLRNIFSTVPFTTIRQVAAMEGLTLLNMRAHLERMVKKKSTVFLKSKRKTVPLSDICQNIPLLQEMAYITHKQEILEYIETQKKDAELKRQHAKQNGLLRTCNCCFDDEVMESDIATCEKGCVFCKECVKRSVEVAFGDGKLEFECLADCQAQFSVKTLQESLNPKLFSVLALKKQVEEVKAAGIEDLETCPFCDFATIPAENDKLFRCLNPECMKESCRECKEPSHIPLKCNEVEKDEDVKRRTYIENKMSEALFRKCHKCGKRFIKSDGCNKITCTCGARQCYVCGKAVTGYEHFNGQGGSQHHLCPLYSDTETLHEEAVLKGAEAAKAEIGVDPKQLKIDPTADIKKHYSTLKKKAPQFPVGYHHPLQLHDYAAAAHRAPYQGAMEHIFRPYMHHVAQPHFLYVPVRQQQNNNNALPQPPVQRNNLPYYHYPNQN